MSDMAVEFIGNESATATVSATSSTELEVDLDSVAANGTIPDVASVEIIIPGIVLLPDGTAVKNVGNAPGLLVLEAADPVPAGTPVGTVILRKP